MTLIALLIGAIAVSIIVGFFTTIYMGLATLSFAILIVGLVFKKDKVRHVILMNAGIGLDLTLVLVLEFQRSAINTAAGFTLTAWQQAHILCSTLAVVFYIPTLILGWQRYRNPSMHPAKREWHIRLGITAFVLRAIGYVLMFSLLSHVAN